MTIHSKRKMHNCLICVKPATKRYYVQWDDGGTVHTGQYCICDAQHCYNVLYSLIDDHCKMRLGSTGVFTIQLIDRVGNCNDDPFA